MVNNKSLLQTFFDTTLKERLQSMEPKRSEYAKKITLAGIVFFPTFATLIVNSNEMHGALFLVFLPFFALAAFLHKQADEVYKEYRLEFKAKIVKSIVRFIDHEWEYAANECISPETYEKSEIFRKEYDTYNADDLITGNIDKTDFECSEVHTEYVTSGKKRKRRTIFKGLFLHADFHKYFSGRTFVLPKEESLWEADGESIVKLENPDFERLFSVYSTDQIEARYILTPTIMEAILRLRKKHREIYFSFIDSRVFCAVKIHHDLFEPRTYRSNANYQDVTRMYTLIKTNTAIIHELDLNTRIWTKE